MCVHIRVHTHMHFVYMCGSKRHPWILFVTFFFLRQDFSRFFTGLELTKQPMLTGQWVQRSTYLFFSCTGFKRSPPHLALFKHGFWGSNTHTRACLTTVYQKSHLPRQGFHSTIPYHCLMWDWYHTNSFPGKKEVALSTQHKLCPLRSSWSSERSGMILRLWN